MTAADSLPPLFPLRLLALLSELPLFPLLCRALLPVERLLFDELPRLLTVPLSDELRLLLRCLTVPLLRLLLLLFWRTLPLLRLLLLPRLRTVPLPDERRSEERVTDRPVLRDVDLLLTLPVVVPRDRTVPVDR